MGILTVPSDPRQRSLWVQFELKQRGSSFAAIARKEKVSRRAVALAMSSPSERMEQAIAVELGITVEQLFPERYDSHGQRIPLVRAKSSKASARHNVKASARL